MAQHLSQTGLLSSSKHRSEIHPFFQTRILIQVCRTTWQLDAVNRSDWQGLAISSSILSTAWQSLGHNASHGLPKHA
jgi:hypothetical protein